MSVIINILITAVASYFLANVLSGVSFGSFTQAIFFSIVLGILNAIVKPILIFFSLPITILTLGLFILVINALIILIAAYFLDGFNVNGFWWALIFSLLLSLVTSILQSLI